jgi:hypothetical protein
VRLAQQFRKAVLPARNQDEVKTAAGETVGIGGAGA